MSVATGQGYALGRSEGAAARERAVAAGRLVPVLAEFGLSNVPLAVADHLFDWYQIGYYEALTGRAFPHEWNGRFSQRWGAS